MSLLRKAAEICIRAGEGSTQRLCRELNIHYNKAEKLMEELEKCGIVAKFNGDVNRKILSKDLTLIIEVNDPKTIENGKDK